ERLRIKILYDTARFGEREIGDLFEHMSHVLDQIATAPERSLASLSLLPHDAIAPAVAVRSATEANATLDQRFAASVRQHRERVAMIYEGQSWTYDVIDRAANRLARFFQSLGAGPDVRVAICLEREPELIVAMLAVVKAGGVYVPLDPAYPPERIAYLVADSGARLVYSRNALKERLPVATHRVVCLDDAADAAAIQAKVDRPLPSPELQPENGAYVIYTSGSTGMPKGVLVTQRNVLRLFDSTDEHFGFNPQDVWTFFHSFAFDFSVWEIWGALLYGGRLVIVPYFLSRNPKAFYDLLSVERVTVLNQTPSAFRNLVAVEDALPKAPSLALRYVIFGGEALHVESLRSWLERHGEEQPRLINMYGITETTVHVTYRPIHAADLDNAGGSLIGEPLPDLNLYILDAYGHLLPDGIAGEIYVGGAGLTRGYLNRPALSAERFVPHPGAARAGERLYRTGDLARRLPDGDIEYLGRIDHQVQIRGFRIELGEIRAALRKHRAVREELVLAGEGDDGETRLVAYLACAPPDRPSVEQVRSFLQDQLPDYMIPTAFVFLDHFPLTPNGKINLNALPAPETSRQGLEAPYRPPVTAAERALAAVWQEVLGVERVGLDDNYFALGGDSIHSIRISSLAREQGWQFSLQQLFQLQTIGRLAGAMQDVETHEAPDGQALEPFALIDAADRDLLPDDSEDAYPLVQLQAGMFFHGDYSDEQNLYQDLFSFRLRMPFDRDACVRAMRDTVQAHPILRTSFHFDAYSQPLQVVHKSTEVDIGYEDLRHLNAHEQENRLTAWYRQEGARRYDWSRAPLLRLHFHRLHDEILQCSLSFHHAILDGWSVATCLAELMQRYLHLLGRGVPPVQPSQVNGFRDFVALEQAVLNAAETRQFWHTQLASMVQSRLTRWPGYGQAGGEGAPIRREDRTFDADLAHKLLALAQQARVPLKSLLLTVHLRVLSLLVGERQIVTGLVTNGRPETPDGERALGLFLNTVPLSFCLSKGSWLDLIAAVFEAEQTLLPYRRFPMATLQRMHDGRPLFETSFNYVHFHVYEGLLGLRDIDILDVTSFEETDIPLSVTFSSDVADVGLRLSVSYNSGEFAPEQIQAVLAYYRRLLETMVDDPTAPYAEAEILDPVERMDLLMTRNATTHVRDSAYFVHEEVERQVHNTPDAPAVASQGAVWTYADLNRQANRLAHYLLACGVGPDRAVALCIERSYQMVIGLLGILKAGACYVPIDPEYPTERMADIIADSGAPMLLTTAALLPRLPADQAVTVVCFDRDAALIEVQAETTPAIPLDGDNLAYLIFTSGSTGRPKGVAIRHAALANHMAWMQETYALSREDVVFQKTPFIFDASVWEFWAPLMVGAKLLLAREGGHRDPAYLVDTIQREGVTILQLVPSLLELLLTEAGLPECRSLQRVFCGGEALNTSVKERLHELLEAPLINLYGPTETTIQCASWVCREHEIGPMIPIGEPVTNTQLYVLDAAFGPVPVGVMGDLYIGGSGLARGYANNPALTAEHFVPNPFAASPGARLYRSGDLARHLPDRGLEYLGRTDRQVKFHGFRIEMQDIEAALARYPGIRRNVVSICGEAPGDQRLVAYIEWAAAQHDGVTDLRVYLRTHLPAYMIPTWFEALDEWPLLPNGKIDRDALPPPQFARREQSRPYRTPSGKVETALVAIWQDVFGMPRIGVDDDFFDLGGDSILSLQIVARARTEGLSLAPRELFEHATVAELARVTRVAPTVTDTRPELRGDVPLTPIQHVFFELDRQYPDHWNQAIVLHIEPGLAIADLERSLTDVVAVHDALHLRFTRENGAWRQFYGDPTTSFQFSAIDLTGLEAQARTEAIETAAGAAQAALNLAQGPVFRALYFSCGADTKARLVLLAHHLVIDGVSWRILVQDLVRTCQTRRPDSGAIALPILPFGSWAHALTEQADTLLSEAERTFWLQQSAGPAVPLPVDNVYGRHRNTEKSIATVIRSLTVQETEVLLLEAPGALHARVPEILVTALAEALVPWIGGNDVHLSMEGHGREELLPNADVSGTLGWFTTLYPVRLRLLPHGVALENLKTIKDQLRQIPAGGVGYGLLRYLSRREEESQRLAAAVAP
ncbi:MAG: amino acid adenylation domain-containing protein, partial [Candidatus Tectomicrobia bacterium]|nr:amino acid adenylation domain-containing protein [Candidatus Tectomicrobia bacterium]